MEQHACVADLESVQRELRLVERVLCPGASTSYVRGTVVKYDFGLTMCKDEMAYSQIRQSPSAASSLASKPGGTCPAEEKEGMRGSGGMAQVGAQTAKFEARYRGDIFSEGNTVVYRLDVHDIDTDNGVDGFEIPV